ncbi:hypothetical protein EDC04DRAFT_2611862 [Pisolithus marmoratus]|nr:hypothetical protein EDC04DRAFT_2611862 [Pisolithus marmoratus]
MVIAIAPKNVTPGSTPPGSILASSWGMHWVGTVVQRFFKARDWVLEFQTCGLLDGSNGICRIVYVRFCHLGHPAIAKMPTFTMTDSEGFVLNQPEWHSGGQYLSSVQLGPTFTGTKTPGIGEWCALQHNDYVMWVGAIADYMTKKRQDEPFRLAFSISCQLRAECRMAIMDPDLRNMMFNTKPAGFIIPAAINRPLCLQKRVRCHFSSPLLFVLASVDCPGCALSAMEGLYHTLASLPVTLSKEFLWTVMVADAEEIDQMLWTLRSAIVYASKWCNSFAPAACLHDDILLLIFEHVLPDRDTRMLRTLSQVCHQWRSTILQAPLLWCKALNLVDRTAWFSEDYTGYAIPNLTAVMIDHFWRCVSLHIEGYGDDIEEIISSRIMTDKAWLLHRLSIHNISCSLPSACDSEAEIPDTFLSVLAPQLISLYLEGCAFNWDIVCMRLAPHAPLLSSLRIHTFHIQLAASVMQLLAVLESLPHLKDLQLSSLVFELSTIAGAMFLAALELPSLAKLEATIDVRQLSTDIGQFMEGVQLVTFKNWALCDPAVSDTHFTDLIKGIADTAVLQKTQDLKVSLPISIEQCLAPDAWAYFLCHLKMISLISFGTHAPVFLIRMLFLDAFHSDEGIQVQPQLLPLLKQITMPSIPELKVLIDILADTRSQPVKVVCKMILDWIADPVVHSIPGDSVWFVDDKSTDSDEADEIDELLDGIDDD